MILNLIQINGKEKMKWNVSLKLGDGFKDSLHLKVTIFNKYLTEQHKWPI